jgi:hypothetical protein
VPVKDLLAGDLSDIRGARATGAIPINERLVNAALNESARGPIQEFDIRIGDNNRLQAGVRVAVGPFSKWFRPDVQLDPQGMWGGSPGLLFTISAGHYAAIGRLVEIFARGALPPGVQIGNNRVAIDIGAMPQAAAYRHFFRHIKRLQFTTRPGVIWADLELRVDE